MREGYAMGIFRQEKNGYADAIQKGVAALDRFSGLTRGRGSREERLARLRQAIAEADAVVIGAGAGLSTSAGFVYNGERFERYFFDFHQKFGIRDMYSGGFYPFPDEETKWAWWARNIYFNRYVPAPKPVYDRLLELVQGKEYFVITTNVDHQFQKAGFDKERLFYTQGDYGLFQSTDGRVKRTYDNEDWVRQAMAAQRFLPDEKGVFQVPKDRCLSLRLPTELIPRCPDGSRATTNLRVDDTFVEDAGWQAAAARYAHFLQRFEGKKVVFLELGVGSNTPVIVKYPFWAMTAENGDAVYACLNYGDAVCPREIEGQSICLDGDIGEILDEVL